MLRPWQQWLQDFEASLYTRQNVTRFLMGRLLLMTAMVISFWWLMRTSVGP